MSTSPFMQPSRGPRRRRLLGRARVLSATGVFGIVAVAVALATGVLGHGAARHRRAPAAARRAAARAPRAPVLSPAGLPVGPPAFTLAGLATPQEQPVRLALRKPPRAGLLFNLSSGRVLWQRNPLQRLPIASLTKMMTALLTVQMAPPNARVLITRQAIDTNGSKVGVLPLNRHIPVESMLYGLLLPSGNDVAVALAQQLAGSVRRFVALMNEQAAKLGLGCTRFSSPHGYYDAGNFSCATDLAVLAHLDLAQPRIAHVARTPQAVLPFPIKGGKLYLYNNNPLLLYGYPGATGLKTGYTVASGKCLVATAERDGVRLGVVLLHSVDPASQAQRLLDSAFEHVYHQRPVREPPIPSGA